MAEAIVTWRTAEAGGRATGPPTASVYVTTARFAHREDAGPVDTLSILLHEIGRVDELTRHHIVGFLVPDLARPHLRTGAEILVLEGPKLVATATVTALISQERSARG